MSDNSTIENDEATASETVVYEVASERRKLFRRLVALAGLGITGVLLSQEKLGLLPPVHATDMVIDAGNFGGGETALYSTTTADDSSAFTAVATSTSTTGSTTGVSGQSDSPFGIGVYGNAYSSTLGGTPVGVLGATEDTVPTLVRAGVQGVAYNGFGVAGFSSNGTGVFGQTSSSGGLPAVRGFATAINGSIGVLGDSQSNTGIGVQGLAYQGIGTPVGVQGVVESTHPTLVMAGVQGVAYAGYGVYGESSSNSGVYGTTAGPSSGAVTGHATHTTGVNAGVSGFSDSTSGFGVYGRAWKAGGAGLCGQAGDDGAIPIVARAHSSTQTAHLQEWQNSSGTALSVVDASGQFGVGVSAPAFKIHVAGIVDPTSLTFDSYGTVASNIIGRRAEGTVGSPSHFLTDDALLVLNGRGYGATGFSNASRAAIRLNAAENWTDTAQGAYIRFETTPNGSTTRAERMRITDSGNVGIGRIPTANQLEVEGKASKTTAGGWLANSDRKIKTDVEDIDDAVATIRKLHPVRFRYADWYKAKHPSIKDHPYYNFIAQEYREVFPDSVQDDGEGLLQMDSHNVTPYLVAAVQKLIAENEQTKADDEKKTQEFRNENEKLHERIAILERTVKQLAAS